MQTHSFVSTGNEFNVFRTGVGRYSQPLEYGMARPDYFHSLLMLVVGGGSNEDERQNPEPST